jgi:ATP-dependent RNA helicase DHX29
MAGAKKKKKPASNPARGFATTSIASKPKLEATEEATASIEPPSSKTGHVSETKDGANTTKAGDQNGAKDSTSLKQLSPEEFERQLEESELQVLVDKHAQKSKRDAVRQIARLQTDRRLLRSQADTLNTRRWLPPELMDEILEVVMDDGRSNPNSTSDTTTAQKTLSEEDLTIRLWTLQQTLIGASFGDDKTKAVLEYILETSDRVVLGNKESVWGLEESLDWLARECARTELPDYDNPQKKVLKSANGMSSNSLLFFSNTCTLVMRHLHLVQFF